MKRTHTETVTLLATIGETVVEAVRASGLLKRKPGRRKKAKRKPRAAKAKKEKKAKPSKGSLKDASTGGGEQATE